MNEAQLTEVLKQVLGERPWPKPLNKLQGLDLVRRHGEELKTAARIIGSNAATLARALSAPDSVTEILGISAISLSDGARRKATQILGQLLLGRCAEAAFEDIYRREMHTSELELRDLRENRSDTDYRLHNGQGRPVYRINIKFHGAKFKRGHELVGLEPEDCFALATYKIYSALQKQEHDGLPYFFAVVGVRDMTGEQVGQQIPSFLVDVSSLIHEAPKATRKRDFEDSVIEYLVRTNHPLYEATFRRVEEADWYILSARRAYKLLKDKLFGRVYALRVRGFTKAFPSAEVDMHFSLSQDMTPLRVYLQTLRDRGPHAITTLLERGEY